MGFQPRALTGWSVFFLSFATASVGTVLCIGVTIWFWNYSVLKPIPAFSLVLACIQGWFFRDARLPALLGSLVGSAATCAAGFFALLYAMGMAFQ